MKIVTQTNIEAYPLLSRGKVRDIYEIDDNTLLIVTTDRMSAFDVIMAEPVPYKGVILNQLTLFWMKRFENIVPNHVLESNVNQFPKALSPWKAELEGRSVIVRKASPLPVECIVRGYITGSGWKDYLKTGSVCGQELPPGLKEAQRLEPPLFTPSTKANLGQHDENINLEQMAAIIGDDTARQVTALSLELYENGRAYADEKGIILADTKFEFGFINNTVHLIDEVLTPDSSRFWPKSTYAPGRGQPSFDKQYLRDWLQKQDWDHRPPPPHLPKEVIEVTADKYMEAYNFLVNKKLVF